jgi:hypothetical protein
VTRKGCQINHKQHRSGKKAFSCVVQPCKIVQDKPCMVRKRITCMRCQRNTRLHGFQYLLAQPGAAQASTANNPERTASAPSTQACGAHRAPAMPHDKSRGMLAQDKTSKRACVRCTLGCAGTAPTTRSMRGWQRLWGLLRPRSLLRPR